MTDGEYQAAFTIASALWPSDPASGSQRVRQAWRRTLGAFSLDELGGAFERLAGIGSQPRGAS